VRDGHYDRAAQANRLRHNLRLVAYGVGAGMLQNRSTLSWSHCIVAGKILCEGGMKLTDDRNRNIAYLRLRPKGPDVETIQLSDELNVDIAADGSVYGIELLNANEQLRAADHGKLVLVDQAADKEVELPLSLD
jgi:uncharacterized protein YuzE